MNCMKCGKEIEEGRFFCDACQESMIANPIRANIFVTVPQRPVTPPSKKRSRRKRYVNPEEQIRSLKATLWTVTFLWLLTILLFSVIGLMMFRSRDSFIPNDHIGQNYSTAAPAQTE